MHVFTPAEQARLFAPLLVECQRHLLAGLGACELRRLTLADLPHLLHLERYCFSPALAFGRRRWRYLLDRSGCFTWGVWQGEQLVAYLCLLPHLGWRALEVRCLAVHWHLRGRGIGAALLGLARAAALALGGRSLRLEVAEENIHAFGLYRRNGFVPLRRLTDYYGEGRDGWRLMLPLEPLEMVHGL